MATTQSVKDLQVGQSIRILNGGDVTGGGEILELNAQANKVTILQRGIIRYKGTTEEYTVRSGHYLGGYVEAEVR